MEVSQARAGILASGGARRINRVDWRTRSLAVARRLWIVWAVSILGLFVFSVPLRYDELIRATDLQRGLAELGLSLQSYALLNVGLELVFAFNFFLIGTMIFLRRSHDWMGLYVSLTLVTFGVGAAPILHTLGALSRANHAWDLPVSILAFCAWVFLHFFLYIFPDGKFVPRASALVAGFIGAILVPWFLAPLDSHINPWSWHPMAVSALLLVACLTPALSQIYRYVRSSDQQYRQQIKWVVFGVTGSALGGLAFFLQLLDPAMKQVVVDPGVRHAVASSTLLYEMISTTIFCLCMQLTPLSIGISIMRYRLWAIDIIITRTLVYIPLTGILGGLYSASITLFQKVFITLTGEKSDAAIVFSTLILASLFTPMKNALQVAVDKRFKEPHDPTKQLKAFNAQVQSVIDVLDPHQLTRRMLDAATAALGAEGGAVFLGHDGHYSLVYNSEEWSGDTRISLPLESNGKRLGLIALGPRCDGPDYTEKDHETLKQVVSLAAQAMTLART